MVDLEIQFEAMLKAVIIEMNEQELDRYPPQETIEKTVISKRCDRRARRAMMRLHYRDILLQAYQSGKKPAVAAAMMVFITAGTLLLQGEVRATIYTAISKIYNQFMELKKEFWNRDTSEGRTYEPGYLPKGYIKTSEIETKLFLVKTYENSAGEEIEITFYHKGSFSYRTDNEEYDVSDCRINGYDGQVFISKHGGRNKIVWSTEDTGISVKAPLNEDELKKVAKNIK